jgi:hypothetical protein
VIISNIQHHPNMPFDQYLKLPSTSFSGLKEGGPIEETPGMRIGTSVHKYILKPSEYNYEQADIVLPIANELIRTVGHGLLRNMICEVPITATFTHDDHDFKWKGIPDCYLPKIIIVDFKIINGSLTDYMRFFNYPNQLRGYMLPTECNLGLIIAYNKKRKLVEKAIIKQDTYWWEHIVTTRGEINTLTSWQ